MSSKTKPVTALAVVSSPELLVKDKALANLQKAALSQLSLMRDLRREEALRGLLVGLTLLRIKESLAHGKFGPWVTANVKIVGGRYVQYLMRLGLAFIDRTKASKPELLALPGDQTELAIDSMEGIQRRFMDKAAKFVGTLSLAELFDKHGIKETKKLGGARTTTDDDQPVAPATPEELYTQSRDELGSYLERGVMLFKTENRLQYLADHPEEIAGVVTSLRTLADDVEAAAKPLLKTAKK